MADTQVLQTTEDGVLTLTLSGLETKNAISPPVYRALQAAIMDAETDDAVRAIVLRGEGGFFCSGGNVASLRKSRDLPLSDVTANTDALNTMIKTIRACSMPVIAAVEGGAAGAGVSLALAADMIVAESDAKFTVAYVKVGLSPDGGVTHFLSAALPRQLVSEMCLLGQPVTAERLHRAGLVNVLAEPGTVIKASHTLAMRAAFGPPGAMATIKALIARCTDEGLADHLDEEARHINRGRYGPEAAEGLSAFLDKRQADYKGL